MIKNQNRIDYFSRSNNNPEDIDSDLRSHLEKSKKIVSYNIS